MGKKLETNLASQTDITQKVNYLAKVITEMEEKMSNMYQLLSELLDNNQEVTIYKRLPANNASKQTVDYSVAIYACM